MKKFLIIILVLIGFKAMSQPYLIQSSRWEFTKGQRFDSAFRIYNLPILTGDTVIAFNPYSKKVGLKIIAAASTPTLQQVTTAGNTSSNAIYIGSGSLDASAAFQVESTTKGILPPVMTTAQKNAISSPANGLVAYDATLQDYYVYKSGIGSGWKHIGINAYTQGDMIAPFSFGAATQAISVDTATMFDYAWSTTGNDDSGPTNKYIGTKGAVDFPIRTNNIERILVSSSGSTTFKGNLLFTDNTYDIGASGATRPRTGYFGTSIFSPFLYGGTSTTQDLTFQTTTGVGTTGADMHFLVGNNGATEAMTILNNGNVGFNVTSPTTGLSLARTIGGGENGTSFQVTGSGSVGTVLSAAKISLLAGYTGSVSNFGVYAQNQTAGTSTNEFTTAQAANYGEYIATTSGHIVGQAGYADGGNRNYGGMFRAIGTKNSATNIGVAGYALNAGSSPIMIGGYFGLLNASPTFVSSALIANNGSMSHPVFLGQDNGSTVFTIADGGAVTSTSTITSTKYFVSALNTAPANATDTGTLGEIRFASDGYLYLCSATNTWIRVQLNTW